MSIGGFLYRGSKKMSRKNLYEFVRCSLADIDRGSRVLNIGAGGEVGATLVQACARRNAIVVSLDISPDRKPDIVGDICEARFEAEFDVVVMAEVLEHIPRPHVALERVLCALRPGGRLVMTVPFIFPLHDGPHDYFRFTRYGLQYLLRDFTDVTIKERNGWAEAIAVLLARSLVSFPDQRILGGLAAVAALLVYPFATMISRLCANGFLTSGYLVTGKKDLGP